MDQIQKQLAHFAHVYVRKDMRISKNVELTWYLFKL